MEWSTLSMISDKERRELLAVARRRKFRRNEVVFHEGDPANSLHLIESGHVSVRVTTGAGDSITLAVRGPGETVGHALVTDPDVDGITFTGSYEVGMEIYRTFSREHPKPTICEKRPLRAYS